MVPAKALFWLGIKKNYADHGKILKDTLTIQIYP